MRSERAADAAGLVAGYAVDALFADPRRGHPVAMFGRAAKRLERALWGDARGRGAWYAGICVLLPYVAGSMARRLTQEHPWGRFAVTALTTWSVVGMRSLADEGEAMAALLDAGDVPGARVRLAHLCGRDAAALDSTALTRASCESIAENTSDAVVAPLLFACLAGVPGMLSYRALNTLDAMVGHPSEDYARFGWACARGDDLANLLPARVSAMLATVAAPVVGGSIGAAWLSWRRDGHKHPSPNAGRVEAAFAGALHVRLGGTNSYGGYTQDRGTLGDGGEPTSADLRNAVRLSRTLGGLALAMSASRALLRRS